MTRLTSPWLVPAHQDPLFSSWRLYQWARNLSGEWNGGLFDGNVFTPARDVLLYSDAIPLQAIVAVPFLWIGIPPVVAYSGLVWTAFLSAGLAMYACARAVSGSRFGALVAAVIFTAAPSRLEHVMHLELLWTALMPLVVLGTVRVLGGEMRRPWLAGASLAAQFLSCIYYGVFMITIWPIVTAIEWVRTRPSLRPAVLARAAAGLLIATAVAGLYSLPYQRARAVVGEREDFEVALYSADLDSYVSFPPSNRLWGWTADPGGAERRLAPGVLASGLAVSAALVPSAPWTLALGVGALVSADASTGANGWTYRWLRRLLPPYRGLRVPARFGALTLLFVALLAAIGCANLARQLGDGPLPRAASRRRVATARRRVRQCASGARPAAPAAAGLLLAGDPAAGGHRPRPAADRSTRCPAPKPTSSTSRSTTGIDC